MAKPASGPGSQGRSSAFAEGPAKLETVTRRATKSKQKSEPAAGRRIGPKRDPEQRTGYEAEGLPLDRVTPTLLGGGCLPKPKLIAAGNGSGKARLIAISVALFAARCGLAEDAWGQVGRWSRIGSMWVHRIDLEFGLGSLAFGLGVRPRKRGRPPQSGSSGLHGCSR